MSQAEQSTDFPTLVISFEWDQGKSGQKILMYEGRHHDWRHEEKFWNVKF